MNRCYQAQLVSTGLGRGVGRVHSVFRAAVNLEIEGELVTLASPSVGALPNGIVLEAEADFSMLGLASGAPVQLNPETLWVGGARPVDEAGLVEAGGRLDGRGLLVDLAAARAWSPHLAQGALPLRSLAEVTGPLAMAVARVPVTGGFAPLLRLLAHGLVWPIDGLPRTCATAYPAIRRLLAGARAGDLELALDGARGLIGLGDGLTPSGDDLLVGFSAGLRAVASPLEPDFAQACAQLASGRTTRIAEAFLAHAGRGEYSARIHRLVRALSAELTPASGVPIARAESRAACGTHAASAPSSELGLADELGLALGWGASSGADTLLGLLLGGGLRT